MGCFHSLVGSEKYAWSSKSAMYRSPIAPGANDGSRSGGFGPALCCAFPGSLNGWIGGGGGGFGGSWRAKPQWAQRLCKPQFRMKDPDPPPATPTPANQNPIWPDWNNMEGAPTSMQGAVCSPPSQAAARNAGYGRVFFRGLFLFPPPPPPKKK